MVREACFQVATREKKALFIVTVKNGVVNARKFPSELS